METQPIAFWNVERLLEPDSHIRASLDGPDAAAPTPADVTTKLAVLGRVLGEFARTFGPPCLVGLAEIESRSLIRRLIAASGLRLKAVEGATRDRIGLPLDGLDLTLLYDPSRFGPPTYLRSHILDRTFDTRDILEVKLPCLDTSQSVTVLVNHWPSRLSLESADRRVSAAYYLRQVVSSALRYQPRELWNSERRRLELPSRAELLARAREPLVVMGDFNDQPYDKSFEVLDTIPDAAEVVEDPTISGRTLSARYISYSNSPPRLFNPFWSFATGSSGSFYRSPRWRIYDQVMLSRGGVELFGPRVASTYAPPKIDIDGRQHALLSGFGRPLGFDASAPRGASDHLLVALISS